MGTLVVSMPVLSLPCPTDHFVLPWIVVCYALVHVTAPCWVVVPPFSYACLLVLALIVVGIHFVYKHQVVRLEALSFCLNQILLIMSWFGLFIWIIPHARTLFCFKIETNVCLVCWLPMRGLSKPCPHSQLSLIPEIQSHGLFRPRHGSYVSLHVLQLTLETWMESQSGCANAQLLSNHQLPLRALRLSRTHLTWLTGHSTVPWLWLSSDCLIRSHDLETRTLLHLSGY